MPTKMYFIQGAYVCADTWDIAHLYEISTTERGHEMVCGKIYRGLLGYAPSKMKVCPLCLAKELSSAKK